MSREPVIAFIGAGNMAEALVGGLRSAGWSADRLLASHPRPDRREAWQDRYGIEMLADNAEAAHRADALVLCVKPQVLGAVLPEVAEASRDRLTVSVAAGTPLATLARGLADGARIVRAMPNQAARVGAGITGLAGGETATDADLALAERLFSAVGRVERLAREDWMDAVTAVAGSGPAFVYRVAEALAAAGTAEGLPPELARRLAAHTVLGAGTILSGADADPAELVRRVASPGGTTEAGLDALAAGGGLAPIENAVAAAARRAAEIAGKES